MSLMSIVFLFPTLPYSFADDGSQIPLTAQDMNYTAPVLFGVLALSLLWYYMPWGYGGVYWFKGPVRTVDDRDEAGSIEHSDEGDAIKVKGSVNVGVQEVDQC